MTDIEKINEIANKIRRVAEGDSARRTFQEPETAQEVRQRANRERAIITDMAIRGGKIPKEYLPLNLEDESWLTQ